MENPPTANVVPQDKTIAILVHIGGIFFWWLAPLIVYLIKKDSNDQFTISHAREALNFQITIMIVYFGCFILSFVLIGIFLFWIVWLASIALSIVAAVKASNGAEYDYPLTIRLIKA